MTNTSDSKDAQIQALQERFDARSKVANERSWTISARDARISLLSDRLSERDAKIVELRDRLSERDTKKPRYAIGCYADGANAVEDINQTIIDLLTVNLPAAGYGNSSGLGPVDLLVECRNWQEIITDSDSEDLITTARANMPELIEAAIEVLNDSTQETRPVFSYWGFESGGDFGLWADVSSMEDDESTLAVQEMPDYLYHVTDHGNISVYRETVEEVWSMV